MAMGMNNGNNVGYPTVGVGMNDNYGYPDQSMNNRGFYGTPQRNQNGYVVTPQMQNTNDQSQQMNRRALVPTYLPGRTVNEEREVVFGEVPTDGTYSFFVQSDFQRIFAKTVDHKGQISTRHYKYIGTSPEDNVYENEAKIDPMNDILDRLNRIEVMLQKQNRPGNKPNYNKNKRNNYPKKEEVNDGND